MANYTHRGVIRLSCTQLEDRLTPAIFEVSTLLDESDGNITPGNFSLREAIIQANVADDADIITFSPTVFNTPSEIALTLGVLPTITNPVKIAGSGADQLSISGQDASQIFKILGQGNTTGELMAVSIENLRLTRGNASGGGVTIAGSDSSANGGAIFAWSTNLNLMNCEISTNRATVHGGGLFAVESLVEAQGNLFVANNADRGGAIYSSSTLRIYNSTLADNTVTRSGGALYLGADISLGGNVIVNCTIVNNFADTDRDGVGSGGGIFAPAIFIPVGGGGYANVTYIYNSIVYDNTIAGVSDDITSNAVGVTHSLIGHPGSTPNITNGVNGNIVGIKPLVGTRVNNGGHTASYAPQQNSPLLGAGSATVPGYKPYDQRGAARDPNTPDIGAVESQHPLATVGAPIDLDHLYQPKPSANANEAFVKGLYQSTVLRAPDAAGLAGWVSQLDGGTSRALVANGFVNSIENRTNQVTFFYRYFLKREPDAAGLAFWVNTLRGGTDEGVVMTNFVLSPEFSGQNDNAAFVNLLYFALLGRQAESAGFNYWTASLNSGMSRAMVMASFTRSTEGLNRVTAGFYQTYLKRAASNTDLDFYQLYLGSNTFGQAAISLLASEEFYANAGVNL